MGTFFTDGFFPGMQPEQTAVNPDPEKKHPCTI